MELNFNPLFEQLKRKRIITKNKPQHNHKKIKEQKQKQKQKKRMLPIITAITG